jgi:hypothetical protein
MPMFLLPLLGATALEMQSQAELEAAVSTGLRAALANGWTLADIDTDDDELVFTMTKGGKVERHVAHVDGTHNAYRVEVGGPAGTGAGHPALVAQDLAAGGGIEIGSDCGMLHVRTYTPGPRAKGAPAARLVGALLAAADDLESADVVDDRAVFHLTRDGEALELHVGLDDGRVVRAELRRYGYGADTTTYTRRRALRRAIGKAVTRIENGDDGVVLVGAKRHVIAHVAFEPNDPDREEHACGC